MGSWNKTCGLSRLPIGAGEAVYVIPLRERGFAQRTYPSAMWIPGYHFMSHYDDYGGGENSSGVFKDLVIKWIGEKCNILTTDENPFMRAHEVTKENFNEKSFFDGVYNHCLYRTNLFGDKVLYDYVMIRKDLIDELKKIRKFNDTFYIDENNYEYFDWTWQDALDTVDDTIKLMIDSIPADKEKRIVWKHESSTIPYHVTHNRKYTAARFAQIYSRDTNLHFEEYGVRDNFLEKLIAYKEIPSDSLWQEIRAMFVASMDDGFIQSISHETRHSWAPGGHEGSQTSDGQPYLYLMEAMNTVMHESNRIYVKDGADWD